MAQTAPTPDQPRLRPRRQRRRCPRSSSGSDATSADADAVDHDADDRGARGSSFRLGADAGTRGSRRRLRPRPPAPEEKPSEPFAFGDFTWLNGSEPPDTRRCSTRPYFTGSFLLDVNYTASRRNPIDNTVVGSTALSRNNEFTLAFLGFGGDFHYENARGRLMTQFGVRSTLVPRNDVSTNRGQFDLQTALRYVSEAYGGYHWDVLHGINLDAGIFMSYVGLFSYDNFENWMYLPSFTSDNTPWFFNGMRLQVFPSDKLKIEPWLINGWQTYGKFNEMPGLRRADPLAPDRVALGPLERLRRLGHAGHTRAACASTATTASQVRYLQRTPNGHLHPRGVLGHRRHRRRERRRRRPLRRHRRRRGTAPTPPRARSTFLSWMAYNRLWFLGGHLAVDRRRRHDAQPGPLPRPGADGQRVAVPQPLSTRASVRPADVGASTSTRARTSTPGTTRPAFQYMPDEQHHLRPRVQPPAGRRTVLRRPRRRDLARRLHHDGGARGLAPRSRQDRRPDHRGLLVRF